MIDRFKQFPAALASQARLTRLGSAEQIPVLLAHPDWATPRPVMIWMHGRTVNKELDPGRYLRWIRAGLAVCAVDLPGHGERLDARFQHPSGTMDMLAQMVGEIDQIVEGLAAPTWGDAFDLDRMGIGGMSAGGMATLRRLCEPHPFVCGAVEGATGWLAELYRTAPLRGTADGREVAVHHAPEKIRAVDAAEHLAGWRPIPMLFVHSEADRVVPFAGVRAFVERLRGHYAAHATPESLVEMMTWAQTGAPEEHAGFGRFSNDSKNVQVDFLTRCLGRGV